MKERILTSDVFFKNFFNTLEDFNLFHPFRPDTKLEYPVDIYEEENLGLVIEVACVGIHPQNPNLKVETEGDIIRITYNKSKEEDEKTTKIIQKGITRRSFDLGYKISPRFNLDEATVYLKNGLLTIHIPLSEQSKPKVLPINKDIFN